MQVVKITQPAAVQLPERKNNLYIVKRPDLNTKPNKRLEAENHSIREYLIDRSQQGDRQAQNELYKLYVGAMYNICRRMMGNDEDAKDVLQEAFIEAFINLKKLKENKLFSAWLK
ncbi:MAG: RNA polymerase sigma factor, partial [Flammeovirgaceae bacterium]